MEKELDKLAPSTKSAAKTIFATLKILKEAGGQLPSKEIFEKIRTSVDLTEWEKQTYEKSGYVRWESILQFYSIDCIKAGFLVKSKGTWFLTKEGEAALSLGPLKLWLAFRDGYKKWKETNTSKETKPPEDIPIEFIENQGQAQKANIELLEEQASSGLKDFISGKNPYEFQDLVAALLRGMGYYTAFVAPKGKDDGLDIIAYQDPLGIKTPRLKVQVKHKPTVAVPVEDIRSLKGVINRDNEVGLFVTSGRFSSEAERFARQADVHIKLINFEDFIRLWVEFYPKLNDEDKNYLPLHPIYFLGTNE